MPLLAYFLTWTTYGTRLHGDERGSVDRRHNEPGTPVLPRDDERVAFTESILTYEPIVLSPTMRGVVDQALIDHCRIRRWGVESKNVRTNHVHIVVDAGNKSPERVMEEFKYWGTRRMREAGLVRKAGPIWTDHGSTVWINSERDLFAAVEYVKNQ